AAFDYFCTTGTQLQNPKVTELSDYEVRLRMSVTDDLTGMYNRRFLLDVLHREFHRSNRYHIPFSLLFIDVDDFKKFNDNYGHKTGDDVLKAFSEFLKQFLRSEDTVGRYGGEEFLLIMPQTDTEGAVALGNRLLDGLSRKPVHQHFNITFSGGIATFPEHAQTVEGLIEMADLGMYSSKMQGKRQISVAPPDKRRDERFPVSRLSQITLRCYTKNEGQLSGSIRNLSHSGISFDAASPLQIGEELDLHLSARGDGKQLDIHGKVVWIRETEDHAKYRVGARYAEPVSREIDLLISPPY
ncbi:MAG TPA: diguanylate cyclase, partial [Spirochaetia bacterium]|nr:diguanylate cyclase [Spirochaetia bacterium]